MRVGGDFYFTPSPTDAMLDLLLIAGGVGINPLFSIINHVTDLVQAEKGKGADYYKPGNVVLLYSAGEEDELMFKVFNKTK